MQKVLGEKGAPRYVLHDRLAEGGMGVVHLGTMVTPAGERKVAIKQLLQRTEMTHEATERLVSEARLVFQLTHANICQVLDLGTNDEGAFIVMEYVPGLDLRTLLSGLGRSGQPLAVACAIHVAREIAQALDYAHRRTDGAGQALLLVHGDVTPRNILLSDEGEVKLADFGIARALRAAAPGNELRGGTPGFAAPESSSTDIDHRADVYSLGVTLGVALGGTTTSARGLDLDGLRQTCPEISPELSQLLERATARRREDRFLSAGELERALAFQLARRYPSFTPSELGALVRAHATSAATGDGESLSLASLTSMTDAKLITSFGQGTATVSDKPVKAPRRVGTQPLSEVRGRPPFAWAALSAATLAVAATTLIHFRGKSATTPVAAAVTPTPTPHVLEPPPPPAAIAAPVAPVVALRPASVKSVTHAPTRIAHAPIAAPPPKGVGYLTISSTPWGAVYVDGSQVAEQTPVYRLAIAAGKHHVMIVNPKQHTRSPSKEVSIEGGAVRVLGFDW